MKKQIPILVIAASMLITLVALFALPRLWKREIPPPAAGGTKQVIIISIQNEGIQREFKRGFEAWHRAKFNAPCEVIWTDHGGTSLALRFVKSEFAGLPAGAGSPRGIGADLLWGGGVEPYLQLADLHLLEPVRLPEATMAALPAAIEGVPLYDPKLQWFGTALSGFGILWNKPRLARLHLPEPKTWADLAEPEFFGEVAAADPRQSGTAQVMVEVILEAYGWDKGFEILARIGGNTKSFSRAAGDIPKEVSMGNAAAALAIDFYAWMQIKLDGKEKIGYVLPAGLTPITPDPIGMLKGAPDAVAARRFIEYVLSPDGQRLWLLPKGYPGGPVETELLRIPVLPGLYRKYADVTNVLFDPSRAHLGFRYDPVKAAAERDTLKDLYGAVFVDLQPELAEAWKAVIRRGLKPQEIRALSAPFVTEPDLARLARTEWSNPEVRNRMITEWSNQARDRYRALARMN
jgi:ABC-type Fe3+ transport system substrate-binding protein